MNGVRVAGQILLWAGFIGAALAATSQREFDLLPESEQDSLNRLPAQVMINNKELAEITTNKISELSNDEFDRVVEAVIPISNKNNEAAEAKKQEAERRAAAGEPERANEEIKQISNADFEKGRTTRIENKWATIPWLWYGLSMAIGLGGVVLLRSTAKSAQQEQGRVAEEFAVILSSLEKLISGVSALHESLDKKSPQEVLYYIDDHCAGAFADFADSRNALTQRFGMQPYAEIMTQFASGERFVNRAWSAAADGYMNEAKDSLHRAAAHLKEADLLVSKYDKETFPFK